MVQQAVQHYCVKAGSPRLPDDADLSCSLASATAMGVSDLTLAEPSRVRLQVTLLPTDEERRESFREHEVLSDDTVQKLALQYCVSVSSIKVANAMIDDNVIGFKTLLVPKQRDGVAPSLEKMRTLTVLPSVSWQSFQRQMCALHSIELQELNVQCLSQRLDTEGNRPWRALADTEGLYAELQRTHDAELSKDFLRVRVDRKKELSSTDKNKARPLTYESTSRRKVRGDGDASSDPEGTAAQGAREGEGAGGKQQPDEQHTPARPSPVKVVVQGPGVAPGEEEGASGGYGCGLGRLFCCFLHSSSHADDPAVIARAKMKQWKVKGGKGGEDGQDEQAIALLQFERHYSQE